MAENRNILILYDGNCTICRRKIDFLKNRDKCGKLGFSDIRASDFQSFESKLPMDTLEKQIHAILPDGTVVSRMEVIRVAYREIGLGWLAAPTGWPLLRPLFDLLYGLLARHRMSISHLFR